MPDKLLNVDELAARLDVSRSTVYDLTARGKLPALRVGRLLRYDPDAVAQALRPAAPADHPASS